MPPQRDAGISGSKIAWYLVTIGIGLLSGVLVSDRTAIFDRLFSSSVSAAQVTQVITRVDHLEDILSGHTVLPGHPVDHTLLQVVTQDIKEIKQDVKELLRITSKGR